MLGLIGAPNNPSYTQNLMAMPDEMIPLSFEKPIYKNLHIHLATLIGGPLGTTWLLAENFKKLGHPEKVRKTWIWGILALIFLLVLSFLIPDDWKIPNFVFPVICLGIASQVTKTTQGPAIQQHLSEGGAIYSLWRAFGIGLICLLITLVVVVAILFFTGHPLFDESYN